MRPITPSALVTDSQRVADSVQKVLRGNLEFGDNIKGVAVLKTDTGAVDTEFSLTHNLNYVPTQFIVFSINKAGIVYKSTTTWTTTTAFFKCGLQANCSVTIYIF